MTRCKNAINLSFTPFFTPLLTLNVTPWLTIFPTLKLVKSPLENSQKVVNSDDITYLQGLFQAKSCIDPAHMMVHFDPHIHTMLCIFLCARINRNLVSLGHVKGETRLVSEILLFSRFWLLYLKKLTKSRPICTKILSC